MGIKYIIRKIYTVIKLRKFKEKGKHINFCSGLKLKNPQYISIGSGCFLGPDCRIEAWDKYNDKTFSPVIKLGNNVKINSTCHIGAINNINIGDDCLLGSHVLIIDHSHGNNSLSEIGIHPSQRDLFSKGGITIGKLCWICENVVVLPGVHIGECCVIGANSVVTKNIPAYSVAVGNPAHVVKTIKK